MGYGDIDDAFRRAAHTFADRYASHRYTGVPLEGRGMLAVPELAGGGLTVWTSQQLPHFHRSTICEALGLPEHAVRAVQPDIGGGFGQKAGLYPEDVLIPFAAWRLSRRRERRLSGASGACSSASRGAAAWPSST